MRVAGLALLGFLMGWGAGILASEIIGIVGVLGFQRAVGIRFLPIYLGVVVAIVIPVVDSRRRRE